MNRLRPLPAALLALLLCACTDSYGPLSSYSGVGYVDSQLGNDLFEVSYVGEKNTTPTHAKRFATYRAAQIAFQRGYPHFEILRTDASTREIREVTPETTEIREREEDTDKDKKKKKKKDDDRERVTTIVTTPSTVTVSYKPEATLLVKMLRRPTANSLSTELVMQQARYEGVKF